ncbi:MAG: puromycin-sensitive aminopeptidase [Acidobacteriaceae bacterium]|nr:puromycin-sensitive aminopeptidase [Acidobacteriaceae bacterium]
MRSPIRIAPRLALVAAILLPSVTTVAQRLPNVARPEHYTLQLSPDLQAATFTGEETIDLTLAQAVDSIVLNAWQLKFGAVTAQVNGKSLPAEVTLDPSLQQATFKFDRTLPAGSVTLKIAYSGILNGELRGFYLSRTPKRNYAVTQFEPTDARRAFPSFDEPLYKATFDVSLIVPQGDTAIGNTNIVSDTPGPIAGEHTITFARTPKMSTYLVAFLVGDFKCLSGESDGVPIRACATPDKVQLAQFALSGAEFFLHYYDNYFGIKYPMPKLDMIAIPDFEAGAMENFGAITYRETAMLLDEKTASINAKKTVAVDVAHEMAHQWFGDMVTMEWWNNIWLNEGFATWMSNKPLDAWKPEWNIPEGQAAELNQTLDLDGGRATRAIRSRAETPAEINEMFDGIAYGKAAAVLLMTENYLGEEAFRAGVHRYLQAHMYGNATAEDFWNTLQASSGKPVDKIMESLVVQPGEPLLTFGGVHDGKAEVSQKRFFLNPKDATAQEQSWILPVCIKSAAGQPECPIVKARTQQLQAPAAPVFYGNAGGKGYYRSRYDSVDYQQLLRHVETSLTPSERITFLGSQWALARAGISPVGDFLNLAAAVRDDNSSFVITTVSSALRIIDQQVASTSEEHKELAAWVRRNFAPALARLDAPVAGEAPDKSLLRAALFGLLGNIGSDPAIIADARKISEQYLSNPASVDPTLAAAGLNIAAQNGDAAFFDQLQRVSQTSGDPQLRTQALRALASFRDGAMVVRALDYALSGHVKNQDALRLVQLEMRDRRTRDAAWQYVQQNWPRVRAQITTWMGGELVESMGDFCSTDRSSQVSEFFAAHSVSATSHALDKARDSIADCVDLRVAQGPNLEQWLQTKGTTSAVP